VLILTEYFLIYILGDFVKNSSGHLDFEQEQRLNSFNRIFSEESYYVAECSTEFILRKSIFQNKFRCKFQFPAS
jgi:hypothetical protein